MYKKRERTLNMVDIGVQIKKTDKEGIPMGKKRLAVIGLSLCLVASLAGCGSKGDTAESAASIETLTWESIPETGNDAAVEESEEEIPAGEIPEGMYLSELTGEPISEEIKNQRPVAVMFDNEVTALEHYGVAEADIVYEMMNSTKNNRITRLMAVVKDWDAIEQLGSIRSTRPTNILMMAEYNAVLIHDGGPFYIDEYLKNDYADHLSGGFARVKNGKAYEFTEYVTKGEVADRLKAAKIDTEYNQYKPDSDFHFNFTGWGTEVTLDDSQIKANTVKPCFPHNESTLKYNEDTQTYDYYEYGKVHKDGEDGDVLTFDNVILMSCPFQQFDEGGYMMYNCLTSNQKGYYVTKGKAVPITWSKNAATDRTRYYDEDGKEITINTGKTYIALCPDDTWSKTVIE